MAWQWRIERAGTISDLQLVEINLNAPQPMEITIKTRYIGLNYVDLQHISGSPYPVSYPLTPGIEAVGEIVDLGECVTGYRIGDQVAFHGKYQTMQNVDVNDCVLIPDNLDLELAASVFLQGSTAVTLWNAARRSNLGKTVLINSVTGGVASLLAQLFQVEGYQVFGTVSTQSKTSAALSICDALYCEENNSLSVSDWITQLTENRGVTLAYDSGGAATTQAALASLAKRGELILYGHSDGTSLKIDTMDLSGLSPNSYRGSNSVSWVATSHWKETSTDYQALLQETFRHVADRRFKPIAIDIYEFAELPAALERIAERKSLGKVLVHCTDFQL